jgi:hypothetical protein
MTRLAYFTLLLVIFLAVTIAVARLVGSSQSSSLVLLFTNPNGTPCQYPCLLGIRPGETAFDDAIALLQLHPFARKLLPDEYNNQDYSSFSDGALTVWVIRGTNGHVGTIGIAVLTHKAKLGLQTYLGATSRASIGELMGLVGVPTSIVFQGSGIDYIYEKSKIIAGTITYDEQLHVIEDDLLTYISIKDDNHFSKYLYNFRQAKVPWHGFGSYKYLIPDEGLG